MEALVSSKQRKRLLLDSAEGIDFSESRVFETQHPYNRGEPPQTESFVFANAIAV